MKKYRFTARYRWKLVHSISYYKSVYRYICQNPVREGLCEFAENYPWSSASGRFGTLKVPFPFSHHEFLANDLLDWENEYAWINTPQGALDAAAFTKRLWFRDLAHKKVLGHHEEVTGT
jgi:hypothetical protein